MLILPPIETPPEAITEPAARLEAAAATNAETVSKLSAASATRWMTSQDVRMLRLMRADLPQLPDAEVQEIYARVVEAEERVVGAERNLADYGDGTATRDNELLVATFGGSVLLEAQHATNPVRKNGGGADHGTGGLGLIIAQDIGGDIVMPRGRQTSNANLDPDHPIKAELLQAAAAGNYRSFFSVHGCFPGKVTSPLDIAEVHGVIGLGQNPTEEDLVRAEALRLRVRDELGMRVLIGNVSPHLNYTKDPAWDGVAFNDRTDKLARTPEGAVATSRLAGDMRHGTVTMMRTRTGLPSIQLEISRSLRLMPADAYRRPNPTAEAYGVYMGYQLCRMAIES